MVELNKTTAKNLAPGSYTYACTCILSNYIHYITNLKYFPVTLARLSSTAQYILVCAPCTAVLDKRYAKGFNKILK